MSKDIFDEKLKEIEKAAHKLRNKMKRADIDFTTQVSRNTADPGKVRWALSMTAPANGLAPIVFIADTADNLVAQIKSSTKKIDHAAIETAYHEAQIKACERTILGHKERIEAIKNGEAEEIYTGEVETKTPEINSKGLHPDK